MNYTSFALCVLCTTAAVLYGCEKETYKETYRDAIRGTPREAVLANIAQAATYEDQVAELSASWLKRWWHRTTIAQLNARIVTLRVQAVQCVSTQYNIGEYLNASWVYCTYNPPVACALNAKNPSDSQIAAAQASIVPLCAALRALSIQFSKAPVITGATDYAIECYYERARAISDVSWLVAAQLKNQLKNETMPLFEKTYISLFKRLDGSPRNRTPRYAATAASSFCLGATESSLAASAASSRIETANSHHVVTAVSSFCYAPNAVRVSAPESTFD